MPLTRREFVQLGLLVLCVPAQYFITQYSSEGQRSIALHRIFKSLDDAKSALSSFDVWKGWGFSLLPHLSLIQHWKRTAPAEIQEQSPAIEVMKFLNREGYFAGSPVPRNPRPHFVQYRVGQVIKHKTLGYRGVIVGWDAAVRAPESWIKFNHPPDKSSWRKKPSYAVLVDVRDRSDPQMTYIAEENIEVLSRNVQVRHPSLNNYFSSFDGAQYIKLPWLRQLYPQD